MKRSYPNFIHLFTISSIVFLTASLASAQITFPNLPYAVSVSDGQNNGHTMCYNPTRNEYLIAYMSFPSTSRRVIEYFRLDSTGTKIGGQVDVPDNLEGSSGPSVCYNSAHQEYLISYQGYTSAGGLHSELRIQRVNATNGALIGGSVWIKNSPTVIATKVAYSPTSDSYLLVWEDQVDVPWPVYGWILNGTAGFVGSSFHISNGTYKYAGDPAVAYNSVNNEYLVTFNTYYEPDPGNTCWNLFAQRVRASDGVLLGGNITIGATTECEQNASLAYDSNMNRYLVGYEGGTTSPWGQFISNTGTLVGARFDIGIGAFKGGMTGVAWNSLTKEWFVTWASCCSADNYALRLTQTGTAIGSPTQTNGAVQGTGNWDPTPVYNSANNEMLICWFWQYAVVYVRRAQAGITQTSVDVNLGFTNIENFMTSPIGGDGDTVGASNIGGHECRRNMDPTSNDFYFYFTVNDGWAFQGNKQDVWIYSEYYDDATTGSISLNYDAVSDAYKNGGTVYLTGTNTWKTQKWHVTDAYFGNRENNGGDFRIYVGNVVRYLDNHTVNQNTPGTTPPGQASAPSPANGATGVSITPTLTWTAGANTTTNNVFFGTSNPPPFAVGQTTTSYAPGTLTAGTTYYWRIDEYRSGGGTTNGNVWSFTTLPLPGVASSPSPANGATGVAITASLSWTAGSNTTSHDVRFGTANPPPFIQNQAGTSYTPATMSPNTVYYWRIDEKNGSGTTTGTVWSFTTLPVPGSASSPSPANGATGVSTTPTLTWTAGSNATSHDVRFGTANPPPFIQNQAGTSYATGSLSGSTVYYWRIDEKNSSGTTTGTVWSFTTASSVPTYFVNSSFESGFGAAGGGYNGSKGNNWTPYVYTGVASDLTFADETGASNIDSGFHSQMITAGAGKEGGVYNQFSVVNGNSYTVTVRCKSGSPAAWCFFGINTSGGTDAHEASGTIYPASNNRSTSWTTFTWTGTATGNLITLFLDTYDGVGYWDTATPGPVTVSNSAFASDANGWNIVVWHTGPNLDGTMAFESGTGNPAGDMLSGGSGGTNNTDSCTREGGEINKAISTSGYPGLVQVQYDLRFNTDQSGPSCIGSCTVLEGDCADKIAVYYSTAGTGGPWTLLEKVNASALTQNVWSTRTINCPSGANNQANFALRFRFQFNTVNTDWGRLDNIKVIGTP